MYTYTWYRSFDFEDYVQLHDFGIASIIVTSLLQPGSGTGPLETVCPCFPLGLLLLIARHNAICTQKWFASTCPIGSNPTKALWWLDQAPIYLQSNRLARAVGDRRTTIKYVFEYFRLNLLLIRAYIQEQLRRVILSRYSQNCWWSGWLPFFNEQRGRAYGSELTQEFLGDIVIHPVCLPLLCRTGFLAEISFSH